MEYLFCYLVTGAYISVVSLVKMWRNEYAQRILDDARTDGRLPFIIGVVGVTLFVLVAWPWFLIKEL